MTSVMQHVDSNKVTILAKNKITSSEVLLWQRKHTFGLITQGKSTIHCAREFPLSLAKQVKINFAKNTQLCARKKKNPVF